MKKVGICFFVTFFCWNIIKSQTIENDFASLNEYISNIQYSLKKGSLTLDSLLEKSIKFKKKYCKDSINGWVTPQIDYVFDYCEQFKVCKNQINCTKCINEVSQNAFGDLRCELHTGIISCISDGDSAQALACITQKVYEAKLKLEALLACKVRAKKSCTTFSSSSENLTFGKASNNPGDDNLHTLINVYPNPANEFLNVSFVSTDDTTPLTIMLLNMLGEIVIEYKNKFEAGFQTQIVDLNHLSEGIYFMKISGSNLNYTQKITITR